MTRGDVFVQLLSEISGKPKMILADMLEDIKATQIVEHKFNERLTDDDAGCLLNELRKEKEIVLKWFLDNYYNVLLLKQKPQGHA